LQGHYERWTLGGEFLWYIDAIYGLSILDPAHKGAL
jgi:hypothetical protein